LFICSEKLNDFKFNESKMQMEFTTPFDLNTTRLEQNKVLVYQEVIVPKFNIEFLDPKTNQKIIDNVQYDFMIMPVEDPETIITHRAAKIAQNGSAQQSFTFKDENVGSVIVRVSNINNTGELADFPITVTQNFYLAQ
jgi:hypothetical protein